MQCWSYSNLKSFVKLQSLLPQGNCGNFDEMESGASIVLQQAKTILDKVKVYEVKIQTCVAQRKQLQAVKIGIQV
ncbi:hypothetical protein SD80_032420 [Scytonema tolypothrichoides VB-61278]|nr:hypothetical protein SD80_032420 [Scytonema tolypothrichoides VB-61278]